MKNIHHTDPSMEGRNSTLSSDTLLSYERYSYLKYLLFTKLPSSHGKVVSRARNLQKNGPRNSQHADIQEGISSLYRSFLSHLSPSIVTSDMHLFSQSFQDSTVAYFSSSMDEVEISVTHTPKTLSKPSIMSQLLGLFGKKQPPSPDSPSQKAVIRLRKDNKGYISHYSGNTLVATKNIILNPHEFRLREESQTSRNEYTGLSETKGIYGRHKNQK